MTRRAAILATLLAAGPSGPSAAETMLGGVAGQVLTPNGSAVAGYPVIIAGQSQELVAITDTEGRFKLMGLEPGDYSAMLTTELDKAAPFTVTVPEQEAGWNLFRWTAPPMEEAASLTEIAPLTVTPFQNPPMN
ncbi:carboxypeptidase-like regulatory domain-containing protein [Frigidibacter oleivorans]|uniref:carboxypeptidase-like regulatory domain-containing protein n=1 Tax=Frigidibacter oleivorans TaxID=2487129 RepID=UPI000F8CECC0|nr:carboxypeptidase-like regulatory domain-containing protein [Frigidibacter oleivorans]